MGWGINCLSFWLDLIRTLVAMATNSSHRVIVGTTLAHSFLIGSSSLLQVTRTNLGWVRTAELAALECLKKSP